MYLARGESLLLPFVNPREPSTGVFSKRLAGSQCTRQLCVVLDDPPGSSEEGKPEVCPRVNRKQRKLSVQYVPIPSVGKTRSSSKCSAIRAFRLPSSHVYQRSRDLSSSILRACWRKPTVEIDTILRQRQRSNNCVIIPAM